MLNKRHASGAGSSQPATKRRRGIPEFGQETEYDSQTPQNTPSSSGLSTRTTPLTQVPTLVSICMNVFATNLVKMYNEKYEEYTRSAIKVLPDVLATRLFTTLRREKPTFLSHGFIVANFIRGSEITLNDLPGVNDHTLRAVADLGTKVVHLELGGFMKTSDDLFAHVVGKLPNLEVLVLRGSTKVGVKTVEAASRCSKLKVVNLNYTTPTPASLAPLLASCPDLRVLKLAAIPKMSSAAFLGILKEVTRLAEDYDYAPLSHLISLKLRSTSVNDACLAAILPLTPSLVKLDISFTAVRALSVLSNTPNLQKLSLTSNPLQLQGNLWKKVPELLHLQTLRAGGIGENQSPTLTDSALRALTDALEPLEDLEDVSLVANSKLGLTSTKGAGALANFVARVGRKCTRLNLGGIPNLVSQDLQGLLADDEEGSTPPKLVSLTLSNTSVDDNVAVYISTCQDLEALALENTKVTSEGVFTILNACPKLQSLDLTSCRSIPLPDRRRFFEVWQEARERGDEIEEQVDEGRGRRRRSRR